MTERHVRRGTLIESAGRGRRRIAVRAGVTVALALLGTAPVTAACRLSLSQASLDNFIDHPQRYLDRYPAGGKELAYAIRNFATFNRRGLKGVAVVMRTANPIQKAAIGRGLAGAVNACLPRDGEVARQIADVVRKSTDRDVIEAYLGAADEGSSPATAAAAPPDEGRPRGSVSLSLDQNTSIAHPVVPSLAPAPLKN